MLRHLIRDPDTGDNRKGMPKKKKRKGGNDGQGFDTKLDPQNNRVVSVLWIN